MAIRETKPRAMLPRVAVIVAAVVVACGLLAGFAWRPTSVGIMQPLSAGGSTLDAGVQGPTRPATEAVAANPADPAMTAGAVKPSFDIVRVGPLGDAVIAGRAQPGSEVIIRDGASEIARAQADRQGAFVATTVAPLSDGGRQLTLSSRDASGLETRGDGSVVLLSPIGGATLAGPKSVSAEPPAGATTGKSPLMAVLVPNDAAPRVLQDGRDAVRRLTLDAVDYDESGAIRFTGRIPAGASVRAYVDNRSVGDAQADGSGQWSLTPRAAVSPGLHSIRVDQLNLAGRVVSRVELPFQRAVLPATELAAAGGRVVVQPGQNLWRLARSAYGLGVRYTVIYIANREQIRDPKLIYPGQMFMVPGAAP